MQVHLLQVLNLPSEVQKITILVPLCLSPTRCSWAWGQPFWSCRGNNMDLDQLPWNRYIQLHRFIPSQRGNLVKIHLVALSSCCVYISFFEGAPRGVSGETGRWFLAFFFFFFSFSFFLSPLFFLLKCLGSGFFLGSGGLLQYNSFFFGLSYMNPWWTFLWQIW